MKMRQIIPLIWVLVLLNVLSVSAQQRGELFINWQTEDAIYKIENQSITVPACHGCAHFEAELFLPKYLGNIDLGKGVGASGVSLSIVSFSDLPLDIIIPDGAAVGIDSFTWGVKDDRGNGVIVYEFIPIARDARGTLRRIESYTLEVRKNRNSNSAKSASFSSNSVLAIGDWYRIGVAEDGIYQLRKSDLEELGVDMSTLLPSELNIFGNSAGQLPYENDIDRPDDLLLNDIVLTGAGDESFDDEDYILFYAKGPHTWSYDEDSELFEHHKHDFVDTSYYFIGINTGIAPARISNMGSSGLIPNQEVTTFNDYTFHEVDRENMLKSGREWYGEKFDVQTTFNFSGTQYNFPNIDSNSETVIRANVISRTTVSGSCRFDLSAMGLVDTKYIGAVGTSVTSKFANVKTLELRSLNSNPNLNINISYSKNDPSASGWLNWLSVNTRRNLQMSGSQLLFRDMNSVGPGNVSKFILSNSSSIDQVWEVTNPTQPKRVDFLREGQELSFTLETDVLRKFTAFSGGFLTPDLFGAVQNQNLHALGQNGNVDMIIVAPSVFLSKAEELADIHRSFEADPLSVEVVNLNHVYNEFSSGMRDVTAIKWFMKMFYDRANGVEGNMPSYLMLFGDGSYDNRNFTQGNTNLLPTYQSLNSLSPAGSYVSDDYFGFLSDDEGEGNLDVMDIGVGRLVVKNISEATSVVNKIRRYVEIQQQTFDAGCSVCGNNDSNFGAWRNSIALVADDGDNNNHMKNSRTIGNQIESYTKDYNIERIFSDAFQQVATPGGARYPDVNKAIDRRVRNGAFIINYIGHGGELGWAQERILDVPTILEWNNANQLPVFMTATCEFTRFDDPLRTSAGELVLLNGNGGAVALMTTTRLVYSGPNFTLNQRFYDALFNRPPDEIVPRLGDISRETKNMSLSSTSSNHRNFSLIGDPALPMALPKHRAVITSLSDTLGIPVDTLKALAVVRVQGQVQTASGALIPDFNGRLNATVFDRVQLKTTLGNDGGAPFEYPDQGNIVYRGNAEVVNGMFEFDFVIPKDISFAVDTTARISLYAIGETEDATGYMEELNIGGRDPDAVNDGTGPTVNIYLNDENFVFGGYTNDAPILVASIFDSNGVNTVGSGIGHDISAVLDYNTGNALVLNDYYESDLNTFKSGRVQYQLDKLEPGSHHLKLKVWDVHNNSSEAEIEFIVADNEEFAIHRLLNYPNPFTTHTDFFFEHNQSCDFLNVLVQIYTVSGKLVKTINTVSNTDGFRNEAISWDGKDDYGDKLATGVYVYKISVRNPSGEQSEKFEKLVILN